MQQAMFYHSTMNGHGCDYAKTSKALGHNLREEKALKDNYIPELTKNNLLIIDGKISNPLESATHFGRISAILEKEKSDYIKSLSKNFGDDEKAQLSLDRVECKKAIKRFINSAEHQEKDFWQSIYDRVSNEKFENSKDDIDTLKSFGKIKRLNNKINRLEQLETFNKLIGDKSRNTSFTIFSKELLYKIPDKEKINIKPEHWIEIQKALNKVLYPNFKSIYSVVHMDENPDNPHLHTLLSGKNKDTDQFDIQDQVMINIAKHKKDYPFKNKKWGELSPEEVKIHGEHYQELVYSKMNKYLKILKYDVQLVKKSPEQKKQESNLFLDQKKPIANREHNRQKKLQKINNKNNKVIKKQVEKNNELKKEEQNLKDDIVTLEEKKSFIEKAIDTLKNPKEFLDRFINYAKNYNIFPNEQDLDSVKSEVDSINDIDTGKAKVLIDIAVKVQNTETKKNNVRKATQSDNNKRPSPFDTSKL